MLQSLLQTTLLLLLHRRLRMKRVSRRDERGVTIASPLPVLLVRLQLPLELLLWLLGYLQELGHAIDSVFAGVFLL